MDISNEELVTLIQSGDQEKMAMLWDQVKNFVAWKAKRMMLYADDSACYEIDDFIQSGYLALAEAVKTYTPGNGTFINWLNYYLQTIFAETAGYRRKKDRYDPLRSHLSLDMEIAEGEDSTYGEITPDPKAQDAIDSVDDRIWNQQLHSVEMELLGELRRDEREMLMLYFFEGYDYEECDFSMGLHAGRARALMQSGMRELRKPINRHRLRSFQEFDYFRGSGLSAFRNTGMSIQDQYLIKSERKNGNKKVSGRSEKI